MRETSKRQEGDTTLTSQNEVRLKSRRGKHRLPLIPLDSVLPPTIDHVSTSVAMGVLGLSRQGIYKDLQLLDLLKEQLIPLGYDRIEREFGWSRSTLEVLWEFRKLIQERGTTRAIKQIIPTMQRIQNERQSKTSS